MACQLARLGEASVVGAIRSSSYEAHARRYSAHDVVIGDAHEVAEDLAPFDLIWNL